MIRCQHLRLLQVQLLYLKVGALRFQPRLRCAFGSKVLAGLLRAYDAAGLQTAHTLGIRGCLGQRGFSLSDYGTNLGQVSLHRTWGKRSQHLPPFDDIPHIDAHFSEAQAISLGTDDGFLPRSDVTIGADPEWQVAGLWLRSNHGQCRFGWGSRCVLRFLGAAGMHAEKDKDNAEHRHCGQNKIKGFKAICHGGK